ncbi:collagen alpha-2(I) chain-like isoform X3 [Bacillus rossius redtenbacheri]|uniref:collagen alpha-2(I) chain-like isoform X3 n=1 Tax=Bacillus rossius redtenbacheri TaxID=93214 RepID=UPI002FDD925F
MKSKTMKFKNKESLENAGLGVITKKMKRISDYGSVRKASGVKSQTGTDDDLEPVSFLSLYRFSTAGQRCLLLAGLAAGLAGGALTVANMALLAGLTDELVRHGNATLHGGPGDQLLHALQGFALGNAAVGAGVLLLGYLSVCLFNHVAAQQIYMIRCKFFESALHQDIGWYDVRQTGDLASRMAEDLNKLEDGFGEKVVMFANFVANSVASVVFAFVRGWELTLVCLASTPVILIVVVLIMWEISRLSKKELKAYGKAGAIAEEALGSIRTVFAFGGESQEVKRYRANLVFAKKISVKRGFYMGAAFGVIWFFIYAAYALAFWYGVGLVLDQRHWPQDEIVYTPGTMIVVSCPIHSLRVLLRDARLHERRGGLAVPRGVRRGAGRRGQGVLCHRPSPRHLQPVRARLEAAPAQGLAHLQERPFRVSVQAGRQGVGRRGPDAGAGPEGGPGGQLGLRQVHLRPAHPEVLRPHGGAGVAGRDGRRRPERVVAEGSGRRGGAGACPLQHEHRGEHPPGPRDRVEGGRHAGREGRQRPQLHLRPAPGLRHGGGGEGGPAVRGAEAEDRHSPRSGAPAPHPAAGRGDLGPGQRQRGQRTARHGQGEPGPHHARRGSPPVHRARRGPHRGDGGGAGGGGGHPRAADVAPGPLLLAGRLPGGPPQPQAGRRRRRRRQGLPAGGDAGAGHRGPGPRRQEARALGPRAPGAPGPLAPLAGGRAESRPARVAAAGRGRGVCRRHGLLLPRLRRALRGHPAVARAGRPGRSTRQNKHVLHILLGCCCSDWRFFLYSGGRHHGGRREAHGAPEGTALRGHAAPGGGVVRPPGQLPGDAVRPAVVRRVSGPGGNRPASESAGAVAVDAAGGRGSGHVLRVAAGTGRPLLLPRRHPGAVPVRSAAVRDAAARPCRPAERRQRGGGGRGQHPHGGGAGTAEAVPGPVRVPPAAHAGPRAAIRSPAGRRVRPRQLRAVLRLRGDHVLRRPPGAVGGTGLRLRLQDQPNAAHWHSVHWCFNIVRTQLPKRSGRCRKHFPNLAQKTKTH